MAKQSNTESLEKLMARLDAKFAAQNNPDLSGFSGADRGRLESRMMGLAFYNKIPEKAYDAVTELGDYSGPADREVFKPNWLMYIPFIGPLLYMKSSTRKYVLNNDNIRIECKETFAGERIVVWDKNSKDSNGRVVFAYTAAFAPQSNNNPSIFYDPGDWEKNLDGLFEDESAQATEATKN